MSCGSESMICRSMDSGASPMRSAEKWPIETRKTIDVSLGGMISSFVAVIGKLGFGHRTCMLALPNDRFDGSC